MRISLLKTLNRLDPNIRINTLLADAGYDSEANHRHAREILHMSAVIPPRVGRPSMRQIPKGRYRRLMALKFRTRPRLYGQRWQVETIFSMIKRRLGDVVHARNCWSQNREMLLMILTHNLAIFLFVKELFYRAGLTPFSRRVNPGHPEEGRPGFRSVRFLLRFAGRCSRIPIFSSGFCVEQHRTSQGWTFPRKRGNI
jgi:hypothetical protein